MSFLHLLYLHFILIFVAGLFLLHPCRRGIRGWWMRFLCGLQNSNLFVQQERSSYYRHYRTTSEHEGGSVGVGVVMWSPAGPSTKKKTENENFLLAILKYYISWKKRLVAPLSASLCYWLMSRWRKPSVMLSISKKGGPNSPKIL